MTPNSKEVYNEDELEPPQWLDNEFFTKVLSKAEKNVKDIEIKKIEINPATVKGDHFSSIMFRAIVEYKADNLNKSQSMIIKTLPDEGLKRDMLEKFGTFTTEIGMYTEVLPRFESYLRNVGDDTKLMAPVLYHEISPRKVIIFEDLLRLGYKVFRDRLPNREESKAAYAKLAKWHAVSYKIIKDEPHYFDKYRTTYFTHEHFQNNKFILKSVEYFLDMLRKTPELQKYLPQFEKLSDKVNLLEESFKSFGEYRNAPREDAYYVLNHGDFHLKNFMFKNFPDSEKLEDVMLLDFQFCHVGPITSDLIYSIYLLLDNELRSSVGEFLQHYFTIFRETLEKIEFNGPIPTYEKFQEQLKQHKYLEIFLMITFLPIWSKLCKGEVTIEKLRIDTEYGRKLFEDREYIDEVLVLIPKYLKLGYLEA